jgi:uncharacterized protein YjbI with pentapeptide repeats
VKDEPVELHDRTFHGERLGHMDLPANSEVVDFTLEDCDVVGVLAERSRVERLSVTRSRLRGVSWAGGVVRDVSFDNVTGADVSCRFSTLRVVVARDSQLPGLDLTEAELDQVTFERCDLRGAKFDHAKVKQLRFVGCDLTGVSGALALRGAAMGLDDVLSLAPSLARESGIVIE